MRNRPLGVYERLLRGDESAGMPAGTFVDMCKILYDRAGPLTIVDLGCGDGLAILSLVSSVRDCRIEATGIGIDREINKRAVAVETEPEALSAGVFEGALTATESGTNVRFIRSDLDYEWLLEEKSVHLVLSNKAVMFLRDKVRFIENVWASLVPDGLAILEVDVGDVSAPNPRIRTPKPLLDSVAQLSAAGFNIRAWQAACPLADTNDPANVTRRSCVLGMNRNRHDIPLSFGVKVATSERFQPAEQAIERWGVISTYRNIVSTGPA